MSRRPWIWTPERLEFLEKNWDKLPIPSWPMPWTWSSAPSSTKP